MYVCLDGLENAYVFSVYKYEIFGYDNTNVVLGFIQNLLGNIITINRIFNQVVELSDKNETVKMYALLGRIFKMVIDFEPVIFEEAGNPMMEADYGRPLVMQNANSESNNGTNGN